MFPFRSFVHTMHALPDSNIWDVNVARSFTRLNTVFVTLLGDTTNELKESNFYFNPTTAQQNDNVSTYLSIGDRRWSQFDRIGSAEHMKRLFEAVGIDSSFQDCGISRQRFDADNAIFAFDTERVSAPGAGYNLSHGQLLRVHMEGVGDGIDFHASRAYVALHHDAILELTSSGAIVHS